MIDPNFANGTFTGVSFLRTFSLHWERRGDKGKIDLIFGWNGLHHFFFGKGCGEVEIKI